MEGLKKLFLPVTATIDYIQNHFKAMLFILILFLLFAPSGEEALKPNNLHQIAIVGPIFDAGEVVDEIESVRKDDSIKGVLISINSPGGAVAPSIEIAYAVKRLSASKPVVVYAQGILASGSYYAAIWANEIMANPGSMVGSIGVIMQGMNFEGLMEKVGIETQVAKAGKYKQVGTADRPWTAYEKAELDKVIQGTYELFTSDVARARGLSLAEHETYADAHIFTAAQAKEVGLIDTIGVGFDAAKRVEALSGVTHPVWNQEDKFEKFFRQLSEQSAAMLHLYFPAVSLR